MRGGGSRGEGGGECGVRGGGVGVRGKERWGERGRE